MDLVQLLVTDFVVQVYNFGCILLWLAVRAVSLLTLTGQLFYNLFWSVTTGVDDVLNFFPKCNNGLTRCGLDAGHIFIWHLSDFYSNMRSYMSLWETLAVCVWLLLIVCSPELRKIVFSCFAFLTVASFAILRKLVSRGKSSKNYTKTITGFSFLVSFFSISFAIIKWFARLFISKEKKNENKFKSETGLNCVACWDNQKSVLLMPCKHVCLCTKCANNIMIMNDRYLAFCPLCRQTITEVMKIYI